MAAFVASREAWLQKRSCVAEADGELTSVIYHTAAERMPVDKAALIMIHATPVP